MFCWYSPVVLVKHKNYWKLQLYDFKTLITLDCSVFAKYTLPKRLISTLSPVYNDMAQVQLCSLKYACNVNGAYDDDTGQKAMSVLKLVTV